ncbi:MAG: hypothetical protein FJ272_22340, partial [Planctomycetes bacterium]|nr:hypothetical protein [Planctomycetota bacterium]
YYVTALNEGDLSAQRGTADWNTVCQLYERTSRIVKEIDPTAKVGGPALAHDPRTTGEPFMRSFLKFCRERKLPLDFICYHAYRKPLPQDYEALIKHVRKLAAEEYPEAKPEHFLDEFNLWHTDAKQDNEYGAAYLAASLHFQRRAGVEKSCIISFNHFLPVSQPPSVVASHRGPFDKTASQTARFLATELEAGGVKKRGILAHPPGNRDAYTFGRYQVTVPQAEKPRLAFFTGLAIKPHPQMDGAVFEVRLAKGGEPRTLFKHPQRAVPWQAHTVALDEWRGQQVTLEFRTNCGKMAVADWAAWGEPKLMAGDKAVLDFAESIASAETGVYSPGYRFVYDEEAINRYGGLPLLKGPVVTAPYFVYQLHSLLKPRQLAMTLDGEQGIAKDHCAGIIPSADETGVAILAWTFDLGSKKPRPFEITVKALPRGTQFRLRQYLIDSTHTNPYHDYVLARKPDNGGRYNLDDGKLAVVRDETVAVDAAGSLKLTSSLESKAVSLFELRPTR